MYTKEMVELLLLFIIQNCSFEVIPLYALRSFFSPTILESAKHVQYWMFDMNIAPIRMRVCELLAPDFVKCKRWTHTFHPKLSIFWVEHYLESSFIAPRRLCGHLLDTLATRVLQAHKRSFYECECIHMLQCMYRAYRMYLMHAVCVQYLYDERERVHWVVPKSYYEFYIAFAQFTCLFCM